MTEAEYARILEELNQLLNDPNVPMEPVRVWSLAVKIAQREEPPVHDDTSKG